MAHQCSIGPIIAGEGQRLVVIAGPCVLEKPQINSRIARTLREITSELDLGYVFKASFDKANRSSLRSARGPGLQNGLEELKRIRSEFGVPVTSDVHEPDQAQI